MSFVRQLKEDYKEHGYDVAIYGNIKAKLNHRNYKQLIDSNIDLANEPYPIFGNANWIVPLETIPKIE